MTRHEALTTLLATVEAGTAYETMGHTRLCQRAFPNPADFDGSREAYANAAAQRAILAWRNSSFDAANALHEAVLPEWTASIVQNMHHRFWLVHCTLITPNGAAIERCGRDDHDPARAWLIAILKALIAMEEDQ